jgi:hypothetical protein
MNTRYYRIIGIIGVTAAALVSVGVAWPFASPPKITWSSAQVYAGITSTTTVTKTVSFTSDQAMQNVRLEAVPEIARFVNIQPGTFASVAKGQLQTVRLTFSAPAGAQFGAYEGTIHLRDGSATTPQTLKTSVTFAVVPLPPDPGEAGKVTLAGIDSDGDGVRDDVERWIALTYPNSARARAALGQYARVQQMFLLQSDDKQSSITNAQNRDRGAFCIYYIFGTDNGIAARRRLQAQYLNTDARSRAFLKGDAQLSGQKFFSPPNNQRQAQCSFDPNTLEN